MTQQRSVSLFVSVYFKRLLYYKLRFLLGFVATSFVILFIFITSYYCLLIFVENTEMTYDLY